METLLITLAALGSFLLALTASRFTLLVLFRAILEKQHGHE
jgi:hypothetical protein